MSGKYEKLKRNKLKNIVETEYGLKIKEMHEGDKGILFYTDNGVKRLKKAKCDEAKILFAASAYEHIMRNGFENMSRINRTQKGDYSVKYDNDAYILQDFTKGKVYEVRDEKAAEAVGRALAELHRAGVGFVPAPGSRARVDWGKWMDKFKANSISMIKYKEYTAQKKEKTRFDKIFEKNIDNCHEKMFNSYLMLKECNYIEKVRQAMACNQITHGEFKKHAIIHQDKGDIFITDFENCCYDICEGDIATLLESFSGKNKVRLVEAAVNGYSSIKPLDICSIKIIEAFLLSPKRFFKVIENYYGKKKNYNEFELSKKLERSIRREERKKEVLEFLHSITAGT